MAPKPAQMVVALFFLLIVPVLGQNTLTACPTADDIVQDSMGNSWAACPQTDYAMGSMSWVGGIKSDSDCANYCTQVQGCKNAVFDRYYGYCHAKGVLTNGAWQKNNQYDAIRPYNGPISKCPSTETNVTDSQGRTWAVCQFTDYQGPSNTYVPNIDTNEDCVKQCAATAGCVKGVFDRTQKGCHIKAASGLTWATSTQYDSMRLISSTGGTNPAAGFTCNTQQSVLTASDGSTFALCTGTDWQGGSIYVLANYASSQACAEACALTPVCTNAIWDRNNKVCHIKAAEAGLTQAQNAQFDQIRLIKKAAPFSQTAAVGGKWSNLITFPIVPAAMYVVPQQPRASKVMAFSANADISFGSRNGLTQFATFDYTSGSVSKRTVSNTQHDMFCPGISILADGRVNVNGGNDAAVVSIYNPVTDAWTRAADMKFGRGYQSSTILSDGKVFTIGGSFTGGELTKNGEVYDPSRNTWTLLNGCKADALNTKDSAWRRDNHAWLYAWSSGSVFQAGPSRAMNWYGTANGGSTTSAGTRNATDDAMCGMNVMYDTGKILAAGGSPLYDDSASVTTSYIISITRTGQQAQVQKVADTKFPRGFANIVVLPDGTSLAVGGQKRTRQFTDIESFVHPELFDPKTNTWKLLNPEARPRNYHSAAVLLGDGTVLVGGGGLCYVGFGAPDDSWTCDPSAQHADAEIFSPPYLFNSDGSAAPRPSINALATTSDGNGNWVKAGGTLTVTMADTAATTFSLVRLGSATHSINTDQRRLSVAAALNGGKWKIALPTDSGILLPGYWFLFAMNAKGTPSIARVVQVRL